MPTIDELDTPAVLIDLDRVEANIARGQRMVAEHGRAFRPHIKTHKIPQIGKMQMEAGAVGLTCQKLGEAEAFIDAGLCDDILISFNIVGAAKLEHLMELSGRIGRLAVVADNETVIRGLAEAGKRYGREVPVLVEVDSGFGRNGARTAALARELARLLASEDGVSFGGLMTFPNTLPNTPQIFGEILELLETDGLAPPVISGGGSPALLTLGDFPMMTEHRAGTYVYCDAMMIASGLAQRDDCAMQVRATVVSVPTADIAVIDAGSKTLTREQYYVENFGLAVEYLDAVVSNLSEEHGVIDLSRCSARPRVGEALNIIPNHCCVVSNMVDEVYAHRSGVIETVWPVAARGATH
jgi:D-serine deaminase-like pyridoxal phosphate-dependent protein